ncbi:TonB-dependent receptor [Sphingomonas sp. M1-B02]|uniref:TonB-dependent receptor n=1 Tax=Sphingomonas sp. M1-B02 TaxID=3114300 RepID=UPI00223F595B|nr:TonB-dependent receptor [Sphingomonas sp. S6-11]UZK67323.1 TonB-dependent receptor [Sphingomonas sp. S6-11]
MKTKSRLLHGAVTMALGMAMSVPLGAEAQAAVGISITRQDMSTALLTFSRQSGRQILFAPELVRGKMANPVNGQRNLDAALAEILRGSGLSFRATSGGGYLILGEARRVTISQEVARPAPAPAPAQDIPEAAAEAPQEEESAEIVVSGFRGSLASAISIKKQAAGVVDAINAQDIADFPDANLADSLQRIPGIAIERDGGEGRSVTVRGLGGDFSRTRFNGLEAISSTSGSTLGGGINRGRSFDYSVFASELFNSIVVRKTQSAEVDEGSLGATIDLTTGRPFDNPGFQAAISAQAAYYDINNNVSPRLVGLVSKTFADDTVGILMSAAWNKRKVQEDAFSATSGSDFSDINNGFCPIVPGSRVNPVNPLVGSASFLPLCIAAPGAVPGSTPAAYNAINQPNVFVPKNPGYGRFENEQERLGLTGTLQLKPFDGTVITIDTAYSRFKQERTDIATNPTSFNRPNGTAAAGLTAAQLTGRPNMKVREVEISPAGQMVYGLFDDTDFSVTAGLDKSTTEFFQADLILEQELGSRGKMRALFGHSSSVYDNPYSRQITFSRFDVDGFAYDAREDRHRPIMNYGFDATNPGNWQFQPGYDNIRLFTNRVSSRLDNVKLDTSYEVADWFTAKAGVAVKRFQFESQRQQRFAATTVIPTLASAGLTIGDVSSNPITLGSLNLLPGSTDSFIVPDLEKISAAFNVGCNCVNEFGDFRIGSVGTGAQGDNRSVTERDISPYVQADFKLDFANGMTLRGDLGLRYASTNQIARGFVGAGVLRVVERTYNDWLPSANAALDLSSKLTVRAAAARVMSRPALSQLTPGGAIDVRFPPFSATLGNPDLDPYRATNLDLGVEWYFQLGSLLSATFFHKNIDSFVQQLGTTTTYAAAGLPTNILQPGQDPNTPTNLTTFENTSGGKIDGFEFQYQQPFTFLPGILKNFGAILNYTHIKSNISYVVSSNLNSPTFTAPLVNVSPNSANGTLYYEDSKLSARVSVAYRDEYLRVVPARSGLADYAGSYSTTNVDASISYKLTDELTLSLDAINLSNQPTSFWDGKDRRSQAVFSTTGRQFFLGARYKF